MVKLKIPGKAFLKSESRISVTFKLKFLTLTPQAQLSLQGTFFSFLIMLNSELCAWGVKLSVKGNLKKNFEMLENGGLRLFLPKMQALYNSGWHPSNIYSCWNCTKEVIQTAKIDIKIITHN